MIVALVAALSLASQPPATAEELLAAAAAVAQADEASALALVEEALRVDPQHAEALFAAAKLARRGGRVPDAVAWLRQLLALDANDDEARYELILALRDLADGDAAHGVLDELLDRQPQHLDALRLKADWDRGELSAEVGRGSSLRPVMRVGLGAVYDSNLALDATGVPETSRRQAGLLDLDFVAGASYDAGALPLTLMARLTHQNAFADREQVGQFIPSTVGLTAIARRALGPVMATVDLRYAEVFVDSFAEHRLRLVAPSLAGEYAWGRAHTLRALTGAELRQPFGDPLTPANTTVKAGLRDSMRFGGLGLVADVTLRRNVQTGEPEREPASELVGFDEIAGLVYAEYQLLDWLAVLGFVEVAGRRFDAGFAETTSSAQLGLQIPFDTLELHAEYQFTHNDSRPARELDRHQVSAGVRVWYE